MHGKRKRDVRPLTEEERKKTEEQGDKIIGLINEFLSIRHGKKLVNNPGEYCDLVATMCPDLPTIYNYKREVLIKQFKESKSPKDKYKTLMNELQLVTALLKKSPKSYSLWSYRQWLVLQCRELERLYNKLKAAKEAELKKLIEQQQQDGQLIQKEDLQKQQEPEEPIPQVVELELKLCNKMLDMDERNFHCWNYRNWLINDVEMNSLTYIEREITYTQQKYENNFSNFSALHFRSKNLIKKYDQDLESLYKSVSTSPEEEQKNIKSRIRELIQYKVPLQNIKDELELIKNAIFIQPNEQGVWLYHKWLVSLLAPFRFISVNSTDKENTSLQITCSSKIISNNLASTILLYDQSGSHINNLTIEEVRNQVGQIFNIKADKQIQKVTVSQPQNIQMHVIDYQISKRNLIASEFVLDESRQKYKLEKLNEQDYQFSEVAYQILQEEQQFVDEIIENEKQSKFAHFHKLYLIQVQQGLDLVFKTDQHHLSLESTSNILKAIQSLNMIAKKQTNYLKNLENQYQSLLTLQQTLEKQTSGQQVEKFSIPSSPTYEVDLFLPYHSLLQQ
ncbi:hypothetical protein ABPG72_019743 [Tetrahymena utriculariae]